MKKDSIKYLAGKEFEAATPLAPFSDIACDFLDDFSKEIRRNSAAKQYPDVLSFAFWCRKGNISLLKERFKNERLRLGRGIIFHIAPSNVPVNFAFSFAFGLLAGNGNIVRIPSKMFPQVDIICDCLRKVLSEEKYRRIGQMTAIVSYDKDKEITDYFSNICSGRMIWGGDDTINEVRRSPMDTRNVEVTFADRYSFGIIDAKSILEASGHQIGELADKFYNDTYLMDQNACSAPHLIFWKSDDNVQSEKAGKIFWNAVREAADRYELADIKVSDKYTMLCRYAIELQNIRSIERYGNLLYVITLDKLEGKIDALRGKFGLFFEYTLNELEEIKDFISQKVQTCVYYGVSKKSIADIVIKNGLPGIDRIVPFGASLEIGVIWDGYDIIGELSRIIYTD